MTRDLDHLFDLWSQLEDLHGKLGDANDDEPAALERVVTPEELGITDSVRGQAPSMREALAQVPTSLRQDPRWRHDFDVLEQLVTKLAG